MSYEGFDVKRISVTPEAPHVIAQVETRVTINGHAKFVYACFARFFDKKHPELPRPAIQIGNCQVILARRGNSKRSLSENEIRSLLHELRMGEVTPPKPPKKTKPRMTRKDIERGWRPAQRIR